jgi:flagellin-like hook-associated protein FlgL
LNNILTMGSISSLPSLLSTNLNKVQLRISSIQKELATDLRSLNAGENGVVTRLSAQASQYLTVKDNLARAQNILAVSQTSLSSISQLINELKVIATQASDGTLSSTDKSSLNTTFQSLLTQIDSIVKASSLNGTNILTGTNLNVYVSSLTSQTVTTQTSTSTTSHYLYTVNRNSNDISQYSIGSDGALTPLSTPTINTVAGGHPQTITINAAGTRAYITNNDTANISEYSVGSDGTLTPLSTPTVSTGSYPESFKINPAGTFAYALGTAVGASLTLFSIDSNGILTPKGSAFNSTGVPGNQGTRGGITIDPTGKYAYVTFSRNGSGWNGVVGEYSIGSDGKLTPLGSTASIGNSGATGIVTDPSGKYLYVVDGNVYQYSIGANGVLTSLSPPLVSIPFSSPYGITINPAGTYAYVTNENGFISQFSIGLNGTLTPLNPPQVSTHTGLGTLTIDSTGTHAYVVSSNNNIVYQYSIGADGQLTALSTPTLPTGSAPYESAIADNTVTTLTSNQQNITSNMITVNGQPADSVSLGISGLDILNSANAQTAVSALTNAIKSVSIIQSSLSAASAGLQSQTMATNSLRLNLLNMIDAVNKPDTASLQIELEKLNRMQTIDYYLVNQMNSASSAMMSIFR